MQVHYVSLASVGTLKNRDGYRATCAMDGTTANVLDYHIKKQKTKTSYVHLVHVTKIQY